MEKGDLVAKTAQRARVAESTAANVLEAAGIVEREESRGGQPSVTTSVKEQERAARKQALEKAEAAFGGPEEPDYSERSGLLA